MDPNRGPDVRGRPQARTSDHPVCDAGACASAQKTRAIASFEHSTGLVRRLLCRPDRMETFHRRSLPALPLDGEQCLVAVPDSSRRARVSRSVADLLSRAPAFGSLDTYLRHFTQRANLDEGQRERVRQAFSELVAQGLFLPTSELLRRSAYASQKTTSHERIEAMAMLTRDRPAALERSLRSYAQHARDHGRKLSFGVVDSSNAENGRVNRALLSRLQRDYGVSVGYAGAAEKRRYALALARQAGVDPRHVEFALGDVHALGSDMGANRNALLLAHAGRVFWSADDDTVCRVFQPAARAPHQLRLCSSQDPTRVSILGNPERAAAVAQPFSGCIWELHEAFTGHSVGDCVARFPADAVSVDELGVDTVERICAGPLQVAASMSGILGDCGAASTAFHLWRSEIAAQLASADTDYHSLAFERSVLRAAPVPTISSGSFLMTTAFSLDARTLLPPFMPVMRGEDHAFALMLRRCFPDRVLAYLPTCIEHLPLEDRRSGSQQNKPWEPRRALSLLAVLQATIGLCDVRVAPGGAARLALLGRQLKELAALPWADFEHLVGARVWRDTSRQLNKLEAELGGAPAGERWRQDLRAYRHDVARLLEQPDYLVPVHLRRDRTIERARALLQGLFGDLGELSLAWPRLMEAASRLKATGVDLFCSPLDESVKSPR